jgi:toxin ParE1/3/4
MKRLKVCLSDAAVYDILEQANWYEQRSSPTLAKRWDGAVTSALHRIVANPHSGSPCTFHAEELQAVRRMPVRKFPKHLIFYRIENGKIVILRVIHGARDLESLF